MDEDRVSTCVYLRVLGVSVALRRTRCMGCKRAIVAGEYRLDFPSIKTVGKATRLQKGIRRYVCLSCAKQDLTDVVKLARKFRKTVIRKLQTDRDFYATRALGDEFQTQAASIVKWRVDKILASRYNTKRRIQKIDLGLKVEAAKREAALDATATETEKET